MELQIGSMKSEFFVGNALAVNNGGVERRLFFKDNMVMPVLILVIQGILAEIHAIQLGLRWFEHF